jgi:hypothetical protein
MQEQTGGFVDTTAFIDVMLRQIWSMMSSWKERPPRCQFHTSLPLVGSYFISGDNPVVAVEAVDDRIWTPATLPRVQVSQLGEVFGSEKFQFWLTLSPYICISLHRVGNSNEVGLPSPMDTLHVRQLNAAIRNQSKYFTLARDKDSLPE